MLAHQVVHEHVQVIHIDVRTDEDQSPDKQELNQNKNCIEIVEDHAPGKFQSND